MLHPMSRRMKSRRATKTKNSMPPEQTTIGQQRVRISFNPATSERGGAVSDRVHEIKQKSAELIDLCESLKGDEGTPPELARLIATAQTNYEQAVMWAVKAATFV